MEEPNSVTNMDSLLFQLALQTRELFQKNDEMKQQINICKVNIAKKKTHIEETKRSIEKLEEDISQNENLVKYYKDNAKSLKVTNNLLVQYEKTLQVELERKRDTSDQDMKMYKERIENYRKVFEQHKTRYCENPLVRKLLKAQAEKEEIEERIRACEEQIAVNEKELQALRGNIPTPSSTENASDGTGGLQRPAEPQEEPQAEESTHIETGISSLLLDPQQAFLKPKPVAGEEKGSRAEGEEMMDVKVNQDEEMQAEEADSPASVEDWPEGLEACGQLQEQNTTEEQEEDPVVVGVAELEWRKADGDSEEPLPLITDEVEHEEGGVYPLTPPARMKAVPVTPTFSLSASPSHSPGNYKATEFKSPAFTFSMSSAPDTPGFSGFDCAFDTGLPQESVEDTPFSFTSSYFGNKKSTDPKSSGFLIDQMESRAEEEFELFFSSKSPPQTSTGQVTEEARDDFSFFNFGKD